MRNIEIENKTIRIYSDELIVSELINIENVDEFRFTLVLFQELI